MAATLRRLGTGHPQRGHATFQRGGASLSRESGGGTVLRRGGGGGEGGETCCADIVGDEVVFGPASPVSVPDQAVGVSVEVDILLATTVCMYMYITCTCTFTYTCTQASQFQVVNASSIEKYMYGLSFSCTKMLNTHVGLDYPPAHDTLRVLRVFFVYMYLYPEVLLCSTVHHST